MEDTYLVCKLYAPFWGMKSKSNFTLLCMEMSVVEPKLKLELICSCIPIKNTVQVQKCRKIEIFGEKCRKNSEAEAMSLFLIKFLSMINLLFGRWII